MKKAVIKREALLEIVERNMVSHVADYEMALEERVNRVRAYFENSLIWLQDNPGKQPKVEAHFPVPISHEGDYKRVIKMLEMDVRTEIELEQNEFDQLVMDNWHWTRDVLRTNTMYGVGADHQ